MMMRFFLFLVSFLAALSPLSAYRRDYPLSRKLKKDFTARISQFRTGKRILSDFRSACAEFPEIFIRRDKRDRFAYYDIDRNAVFFNSRQIVEFFLSEKKPLREVIEILYTRKDARREWVKYADAVFVHELSHAIQNCKYRFFRNAFISGKMTEFEYEAYLNEDMYFHDKMKAEPSLLVSFLKGEYTDPYLEHDMESYLNLSLSMDGYRRSIGERYVRDEGYVDMDYAVKEGESSLEKEKILAYASGRTETYVDKGRELGEVKRIKKKYSLFLEKFYREKWPSFSLDALEFIGDAALRAGNYPLALDCFASADAESEHFSEGDMERIRKLKAKAAVAILEAQSALKDNSGKMDFEELSLTLRAVDEACARTGRPFPEGLVSLKKRVYPEAVKYYMEKVEKSSGNAKAYYGEILDFFIGMSR